MKYIKTVKNLKNSKGVVLIITSVILVSMLFLTLATVNTSIINSKITSSEQSMQQARIAAEAAVRAAEEEIANSNLSESDFTDDCKNGKCKQDSGKGIWKKNTKWQNAKSAAANLKEKSKLKEDPKYLIELIGEKKKSESLSVGTGYEESEDYTSSPVYRVTGKAKGKQGNKEAVIQSTFH